MKGTCVAKHSLDTLRCNERPDSSTARTADWWAAHYFHMVPSRTNARSTWSQRTIQSESDQTRSRSTPCSSVFWHKVLWMEPSMGHEEKKQTTRTSLRKLSRSTQNWSSLHWLTWICMHRCNLTHFARAAPSRPSVDSCSAQSSAEAC